MSQSTYKKSIKLVLKLSFFIGFVTLLSMFMARNMLPTQQQAPTLKLGSQLSVLTPTQQLQLSNKSSKLVYFFAPWCTVCALSQPSLSAYANVKPNVEIIMIALDWESAQEVKAFKDEHQFDATILLATNQIKNEWQVDAYPSYYFIDQQGNITSKDRGLVTLPGLIARTP